MYILSGHSEVAMLSPSCSASLDLCNTVVVFLNLWFRMLPEANIIFIFVWDLAILKDPYSKPPRNRGPPCLFRKF